MIIYPAPWLMSSPGKLCETFPLTSCTDPLITHSECPAGNHLNIALHCSYIQRLLTPGYHRSLDQIILLCSRFYYWNIKLYLVCWHRNVYSKKKKKLYKSCCLCDFSAWCIRDVFKMSRDQFIMKSFLPAKCSELFKSWHPKQLAHSSFSHLQVLS